LELDEDSAKSISGERHQIKKAEGILTSAERSVLYGHGLGTCLVGNVSLPTPPERIFTERNYGFHSMLKREDRV